MEKHSCKLCFRRFSSGRALGGHMRSHVMAGAVLPAGKRRSLPPDFSASASSGDAPPAGEEFKGSAQNYVLRENPRKSYRLVDPEFSSSIAASSMAFVQDLESETESSIPIHRRRSKRPRPASEPESSVSDAMAEEDVAISLMMLSRDVWARSVQEKSDGDGEEKKEDDDLFVIQSPLPKRSRYQCETCKKGFRSYQALGGHRASHKKMKGCGVPAVGSAGNADLGGGKIHQCPICFRVFGSGQALGGHKRSHLAAAATATITIAASPPARFDAAKYGESLIDLNLPAPVDEDNLELSAVSDAEFSIAYRPSY